MDWPFFPLINRYADHPITRNLDAVVTRFVSSMDTVKAEGVKKTPLLFLVTICPHSGCSGSC
jgi:ABC-2 type transport system permease protein